MIWGDSVTEIPAWYPRYIEGYLLACTGRQDIKVFTTGHSGATLGETLTRQIDLQAFNPTVVQFFYGFNDVNFGETSSQWDSTLQSVIALYKGKGIIPIEAGPGWTDGNNGNPATPDAFEQSLLNFNVIAHTDAVNTGAYESDICDSMEISTDNAVAAYGTSYTIGEHYTPNGAILAAYEDLKTMGCSGNIGTVNVNMSAGTATASTGHTVVSYSNGTVILDSTIYPFCYNFDPSEYGGTTGIASMLPYVSFSQDLNRFVLTVTNLGAASANVTWGGQTLNFTSAQLAAGVNLPAQFTSTPFDVTFAQIIAAIVNKQYFEDYETKGTSNYFGNDNGGNVDTNMIAYQAQLDAGVRALIVPVRHTISIVPQGASTAVVPVITGTMMAYPLVGQSFSYQISALNSPSLFTATGLPNGLSMNSSGLITGTPTATGVSVVSLSATNVYGTSLPTHLTLTVTNPIPPVPTITSPMTATATVGVPFSYQITATNNPTNYFVVVPSNVGTEPPNSSLPPGLTYNTTSGVFSGTPTLAGTYNVELAAVNAGGVGVTNETSPFVLTINPASGGAPPAPTGLTATAGSSQVSLSWGSSAGATSYNVYRGTSAGGESTTALATGVTSSSYVDTSVTNGTTYYYTVAAVNSSGTSGYSNEASAKPVSGLPAAPTGLTATAGNAQVSLSWTASSGATSYNVYRGSLPNQENTTPIATGVTTTSYLDTTVNNGPTFYYKVAAVNSSGTSVYSNEASAAPTAPSAPPAPTGLGATAGNALAALSWTASSGATSYNVYRGTSAGGESSTAIATGITTTSYSNTGLTNGTTYYYKVAAVNAYGTSGYSNEASATPTAGGGTTTYYQDSFTRSGDMTGSKPDVTDTGSAIWSNLAGTGQYPISGGTAAIATSAYSWSAEYLPVNGTSGITLDGTKNFTLSVVVTPGSTGLTGISLNTAAPGNLFSSDFAALATCSGFIGSYSFNGGLIYYNFAPGITGATTMSLAYNATAGTVTYTVGSTTVYTQTGVTAAQVAAIRYVSLGDDGYGGGAATPAPTFDNFTFTVGSGGSVPAAPTGLAATGGNAQVALSWTASSGATSYNVYRGTTAGGESTTAIATGITTTTYANTGLTNGTTYYYKVAAVNGSGTSGYSNEANATPSVPTYALTVTSGTGSGSYAAGTVVTVTANAPQSGYQFAGWTGATSALANPASATTTLTMPAAATSITATYSAIPTYALTVTNGTGSGSYAAGTVVTVTANAPQSGYQFAGWTGATSALANPASATTTLTMPAAATSITATYSAIPTYALTVTSGTGSGNYTAGTVVTVTANAPASGYRFAGWTGATSALANPASATTTLTMPAAATSITATYSAIPTYALTVTSGTGSGSYAAGTVVTVTANAPQSGYQFAGWTGATSALANPASATTTLTMPAAATSITATYSAIPTYALTVTSGTGSGSYAAGTVVTVTANAPQSGYQFAGWTGATSALANPASATTTLTMPAAATSITATYSSIGVAPPAPTGLGATAGNALAALSWTASSGATSYNVYRGTSAGGESTTAIATGITTTSYSNTGLTNGTTYYYKVAAVNAYGTSGYSNEASATPTAGGGTTTYYQDSFTRSGDMTGSKPDVTDTGSAIWSNLAGTGQYPISGGTAAIATSAYSWSAEYLPVNGTSGITLDGTKNFTLSVVVTPGSTGLTGISLNTAAPGNLFSSDFAALATCSGFIGSYSFNSGLINYNFAPGITGATTMSLAYNATAGTVTYTVGSTTVYTQTGVTAAQVAAIRYVSLGDDGYGGGAATPAPTFDNFTFTVGSGGSVPAAPTGLAATGGNAQVALSWTASSGATSYNVYRGTTAGGESTTAIATGITTTTYTDTGLANGMTFYYKVAAVNGSGTSGYSNEASGTTTGGTAPAAPTSLTATAGNAQVPLSWTASTGATSYNVYRGTTAGGESSTAIAAGITTTSFTNTGLTNGTTYYYKVAAVNSYGTSPYSNEAIATPTAGGGAITYYQDSFSRSGDVTGSKPDVTDTGAAIWSNLAGTGQYPISGGTAAIATSAYSWSAEYLPVNGASGITLDGTKNFTLSVVVTSGPSGRSGISLNTAAPGNLFSSEFAALSTCSGFAGAYAFNGGLINYNYAAGITGPTTISLVYNATAGTVTYTVGSTTVYTQTGVTAAQVAAIRYVSLGDDGYGGGAATPAPTFDNFTFTVGGP